jgi:hypothetical protein
MWETEDVLEVMNCRDHELILDHPVEMRKQRDLEKAKETEPPPESTERTMEVLSLLGCYSE